MIRIDEIKKINEIRTNFQLLNISLNALEKIVNALYNIPNMIIIGKTNVKNNKRAKGDISILTYQGSLINLSIKLRDLVK
jgi:hypothetical protein